MDGAALSPITPPSAHTKVSKQQNAVVYSTRTGSGSGSGNPSSKAIRLLAQDSHSFVMLIKVHSESCGPLTPPLKTVSEYSLWELDQTDTLSSHSDTNNRHRLVTVGDCLVWFINGRIPLQCCTMDNKMDA